MNSTNRSHLPSINQIIVNKDFIGLAGQLEDKRRERRVIDEQQKILQSRITSLQNEQEKTNRQIKQKQEKMAQILALRQRQEEDRLFKEELARLKEKQIDVLHQKAEVRREIHQKNKQSAFKQIISHNQNIFLQERVKRKGREQIKEINKSIVLQDKQQVVDHVNSMKETGRIKVVKFKQQKNLEFIDEYKNRMERQELKKSWKIDAMNTLQKREEQLIKKLQVSTAQHEKLAQSFATLNKLDLKDLQKCVLSNGNVSSLKNTIETRISGATVFSEAKGRRSLMVGRSRDRLNLQQYKLHRRSHFSNTIDEPLNPSSQSNKQIATPKLTASRGDNIEQELIYGKDDEERRGYVKISKRKRNLHANRYKDYEIF